MLVEILTFSRKKFEKLEFSTLAPSLDKYEKFKLFQQNSLPIPVTSKTSTSSRNPIRSVWFTRKRVERSRRRRNQLNYPRGKMLNGLKEEELKWWWTIWIHSSQRLSFCRISSKKHSCYALKCKKLKEIWEFLSRNASKARQIQKIEQFSNFNI